MGDLKAFPAIAEHIIAHDADGGVVGNNFRGRHDDIPAEGFGVELYRLFEVGNGNTYVREGSWIRHVLIPCVLL